MTGLDDLPAIAIMLLTAIPFINVCLIMDVLC